MPPLSEALEARGTGCRIERACAYGARRQRARAADVGCLGAPDGCRDAPASSRTCHTPSRSRRRPRSAGVADGREEAREARLRVVTAEGGRRGLEERLPRRCTRVQERLRARIVGMGRRRRSGAVEDVTNHDAGAVVEANLEERCVPEARFGSPPLRAVLDEREVSRPLASCRRRRRCMSKRSCRPACQRRAHPPARERISGPPTSRPRQHLPMGHLGGRILAS